MTFVFMDSVYSPFGTPCCQFVKVLLQIFHCQIDIFTHSPLACVFCKLGLVGLVVTRIWHVIDIDKKSDELRFEPYGTPAFG